MKRTRLSNKFLFWLGRTFYAAPLVKNKLNLKVEGGLDKVEPPFLIYANHASFADLAITVAVIKQAFNVVVAPAQLIKRDKLLRALGAMPKRQFASEIGFIRDVKDVLSRGRSVLIYPEGKLSVDGKASPVQPSAAKLAKFVGVPLVTVICHGNYLYKPRWASKKRKVKCSVDVNALTKEQVKEMSAEQLNAYVQDRFSLVDDYAYQKANGVEVSDEGLCEGLNTILYKCPSCKTEFHTVSSGNELCCLKCGCVTKMDKFGVLSSKRHDFDSVTKWNDWQRECVKDELKNNFSFDRQCKVEILGKSGYVKQGDGALTFDVGGMTLTTSDKKTETFPSETTYTLSFDAQYVYLSTKNATFRLTPDCLAGETAKLNLAVEEAHKLLL